MLLDLQHAAPRDRASAPKPVPIDRAPPDPIEPIMRAQPTPQAPPVNAAAQLAEQDRLLRESIAAERQRVLDRAHQKGYETGLEQARAEYAAQLEALQQLISSTSDALNDGIAGTEDVIVEIAFEAVCRVLGDSFGRRDGVLAAVREVIRGVREREQLLVRVAPQHYELIVRERQQLLRNGDSGRIELVSDERVELGGCLIETSGGTLDGRLETQLQRLRDTLVSASRLQPEVNS
jgi:flagellar assembly protein FliH